MNEILVQVAMAPTTIISTVVKLTWVSYESVWKELKLEEFFPYKMSIYWWMHILLNGNVNKHNCRYNDNEKAYCTRGSYTLYRKLVNCELPRLSNFTLLDFFLS